MTDTLQAQVDQHAYALRTVQFSTAEVRLGRQDSHNEICPGGPPGDDLDAKILAI
jgi:hypothetical protein